MSLIDAESAAQKEYETELSEKEKGILRNVEQKKRYMDMLLLVRAWTPPTNDHVKLKEFMIDQITESIKFDCGDYWTNKNIKRPSGKLWRLRKINDALHDMALYNDKYLKEVERTDGRNQWIQQLRDSL